MAIKQFKPTSPSRRGASVVSYKELDKVAPLKSLLDTVKKQVDVTILVESPYVTKVVVLRDTTVWLILKERSVKLKVR